MGAIHHHDERGHLELVGVHVPERMTTVATTLVEVPMGSAMIMSGRSIWTTLWALLTNSSNGSRSNRPAPHGRRCQHFS